LPAVDVGQSVSRVGGAAQRSSYRAVAGDLKLSYAQFQELESFARFGTRLDDSTRQVIEHGRRIRECLKQTESSPVPLSEQLAVLIALAAGSFDRISIEQIADAEKALRQATVSLPADLVARFTSAEKLSDADRQATLDVAIKALAPFQPVAASRPAAATTP
jgi:F-type H+-transporting ATPase subunit alpha